MIATITQSLPIVLIKNNQNDELIEARGKQLGQMEEEYQKLLEKHRDVSLHGSAEDKKKLPQIKQEYDEKFKQFAPIRTEIEKLRANRQIYIVNQDFVDMLNEFRDEYNSQINRLLSKMEALKESITRRLENQPADSPPRPEASIQSAKSIKENIKTDFEAALKLFEKWRDAIVAMQNLGMEKPQNVPKVVEKRNFLVRIHTSLINKITIMRVLFNDAND